MWRLFMEFQEISPNRLPYVEMAAGYITVAAIASPFLYAGSKVIVGYAGFLAKGFGGVVNGVGLSVLGQPLSNAGDRLVSFATSWGWGGTAELPPIPMPEAEAMPPVPQGLDQRTVALVVAAPVAAAVGSRAVAGVLGLGAKGFGQAAHYAGSDRLEQKLNDVGDKLISFATRKERADLKAGAAMTAAALVVAYLAQTSLFTG